MAINANPSTTLPSCSGHWPCRSLALHRPHSPWEQNRRLVGGGAVQWSWSETAEENRGINGETKLWAVRGGYCRCSLIKVCHHTLFPRPLRCSSLPQPFEFSKNTAASLGSVVLGSKGRAVAEGETVPPSVRTCTESWRRDLGGETWRGHGRWAQDEEELPLAQAGAPCRLPRLGRTLAGVHMLCNINSTPILLGRRRLL